MSTETSMPFFAPDRKVRTTFAVIISLVAVTATAALVWQGVVSTQGDHTRQLAGHDATLSGLDFRVRKLEDGAADIAVIKNNVEWIRRELEKQRREK